MPSTNNSSIVVLEGDYTSTGVYSIINVPKMNLSTQDSLNSLFLSNLSLLQLNDKTSYPIVWSMISAHWMQRTMWIFRRRMIHSIVVRQRKM